MIADRQRTGRVQDQPAGREDARFPRVAVFAPYRVWPPDNGGRALISSGCAGMARAGVPVRCFALRTLREGAVTPPDDFDYVERRSWWSALNGLDRWRLSKLPFIASLRFYAPRMARWALDFRADVVEVHMPWLMGLRRWLPSSIPVVLHAQNVENDWYRPVLAQARFPRFWSAWLRRIERRAVCAADRILTLTDRDGAELTRLYGVPPERIERECPGIVPHPAAARSHTPDAPGVRKRAAFCGSRFSDNLAAARRLLETLAPARPDWDFEIAGTVCGELKGLALPPNARLLGYVAELDAWLAGCDVFVHPVKMETGINIKLLSALGNRLPVLATPEGARGFEPFVGRAIRVEPLERFPEALRAPPRWSAGDEAALRAYDWSAIIEQRLERYRRWIAAARAEIPA